MTELHEATTLPGGDQASLMERLRAQQREIKNKQSVLIQIPGYKNPQLVSSYRLIDPTTEGKAIGALVKEQFDGEDEQLFYALVDLLCTACEGIYMRHGSGADLIPVDPDGLGACRYEERLAEAFGIETVSARDVVLGVFAGNKVSVMAHSMKLQRWFADTSVAIDGELLGEF